MLVFMQCPVYILDGYAICIPLFVQVTVADNLVEEEKRKKSGLYFNYCEIEVRNKSEAIA